MRIERVQSEAAFKEFVDFPYQLYSQASFWVPPLKKEEIRLLSPGLHPFWQTAQRELFLARADNKRIIGRIAAIVDEKYNDYSGEKCGAFGFFECENIPAAAFGLLDAAKDWLVSRDMAFMRGPLNPSANYTCGLLVSGFELAPALMMPWNPAWYPPLLENWGLRKKRDLFAYLIERASLSLPDWVQKELARVKDEGRFEFRPSSKATLQADASIMLQLYRESWAKNWGFSPLSGEEEKAMVKELVNIVDPDFFVLFFYQGKPAGGMVALPDMNPLLKRLNGKLGLSAPWHYWRTYRQLRRGYRIMLFGILPEHRLHGLPLLLLDHFLAMARRRPDFEWVEGSWVLEDNSAIDSLIEDFGGKITKRYRIYQRDIAPC